MPQQYHLYKTPKFKSFLDFSILYNSNVFQPFQRSRTLCSNFDCSRKLCLLGGFLRPEIRGQRPRAGKGSWRGGSEPLHCPLSTS